MKTNKQNQNSSGHVAFTSLKKNCKLSIALLIVLFITHDVNAQSTFYPGRDWLDVNGNVINAVEGGIIKVGSLYYLWGLDRSQNNYAFRGVNMYSSPDLKTWTFVNTILSSSSHADLANNSVVERPKLLYNSTTGQFVLWVHYEGQNAYATAEVGYATCSTVGGNYTWQSHFRPLGNDSRDMNVFKDNDGKAYLICSVNSNQNVVIMQLNSNYTAPVSEVFRGYNSNDPSGIGCEGHSIFKSGSTYFWIESFCTGWDPNDNRYYTATSLAGPWTSKGNIAPAGAKTYQSQVSNVFAVSGTSGTTYVYFGDRWSVGNYSMTRLILQPLQITGSTAYLPWYDQWSISTSTGVVTPGPAINFNGQFRIMNRNSWDVLDVADASTADAAQIIQWPWTGGNNQKWTILNLGRGEYSITNVNSGKVLDNWNSSRTVGTDVKQYTNAGSYNQRWHIIKDPSGYYRIVSVQSLGKTLEIANSSTTDGEHLVIGDFAYGFNQEWELFPVDGSVTIQENSTGFCSVDGTIDNNYTGYTGSGFANPSNSASAGVNWRVNFGTSGTKIFTIRYANGSGSNRPANLLINGTVVASAIAFPATSSWATWSTISVSVNVNTDPSATVRLQSTTSGGAVNIDYLTVTNSSAAECTSTGTQGRTAQSAVTVRNLDKAEAAALQVFPNPFKERTLIKFSLSAHDFVNFDLYNSSGIKVKEYHFGRLSAGDHQVEVDGKQLQAGIYLYRATINGENVSGKLLKLD